MTDVESKSALASDERIKIENAFLAKKKELEELRNRAMGKGQELRALENTLAQRSEERKAEIENLKRELGDERQEWMTGMDEKHHGET